MMDNGDNNSFMSQDADLTIQLQIGNEKTIKEKEWELTKIRLEEKILQK